MPLRLCLVTPHAWSVPHDTNEHVEGVADALRARGHEVVVLAPSLRSAELLAGRRALQAGELEGVVAVSRAVPVSPRSAVGLPVGVRANVATALRRGGDSVVVLGGAQATINMAGVMVRRHTITGSTLRGRSNEFKALLADEIARKVWPSVVAGTLRPALDRAFPLVEAAAAHARMEAGAHVGKIVLEIA